MTRATVLTAVVLMTASSTAAAQTTNGNTAKGKGREPSHSALLTRMSPLDLLIYASVREELKLTPAQEARLKECQDKLDRFKQDSRKMFQELGEEPDLQTVDAFWQKRQSAEDAIDKEMGPAILKSLEPGQRTRLDQIGIQTEGTRAFLRPEFQERLNMDPGQIELIREIVIRGNAEAREAGQVSPELKHKAVLPPVEGQPRNMFKIDPKYLKEYEAAFEKSKKAAADIRASMERQIAKLLRPKQRQLYQSLRGEPFDLSSMRKFQAPPKPKNEAKVP